jgi:hypothetical protein
VLSLLQLCLFFLLRYSFLIHSQSTSNIHPLLLPEVTDLVNYSNFPSIECLRLNNDSTNFTTIWVVFKLSAETSSLTMSVLLPL